jgi:hypothetical protein
MKSSAMLTPVFCSALLCGIPWAASVADDTPTQGVWQKHEYRFSFFGFTTTYSCDGLADKLKLLLIAAGARMDAKSQPAACTSGFGRPDRFASAYLTFYTLAAAGADQASDAGTVNGNWRVVKFMPRTPSQLALGDCELIEQFRDRLLPMFSTRNIDNRTACVPHQLSGSDYSLTFDSFAAVDTKPGSPKAT